MENQQNQENTSFNDQSRADRALDDRFDKTTLKAMNEQGGVEVEADGVNAESMVRETEDASLQDKEYSFDEDLTGTEEYHDADSFGGDDSEYFESDLL